MENTLRALDDDTHAPVLINPSVTRDAFSPSGFPARHWAVVLECLRSAGVPISLIEPGSARFSMSVTACLGQLTIISGAPVIDPRSARL